MKPYIPFVIGFLILSLKISGQILDGDKRVVFPKEKVLLFDKTRDSINKRFTPSLANIDNADSVLNQYFQTVHTRSGTRPQLEKYFRQYVGLWFDGRTCIYINAFCQKPDYFFENTYYPRGGGECFFKTYVDINSNQIVKFSFNAPK